MRRSSPKSISRYSGTNDDIAGLIGTHTTPVRMVALAKAASNGLATININSLAKLADLFAPLMDLLKNQLEVELGITPTVTIANVNTALNSIRTTVDSSIPTITLNQDQFNTLMTSQVSSTDKVDQAIKYLITYLFSGIYISNTQTGEDLPSTADTTACFPSYIDRYTQSTNTLLSALVEIGRLTSDPGGGPMNLNAVNAVLATVGIPPLDNAFDSVTPEYRDFALLGCYYYAWVGKYVFKI